MPFNEVKLTELAVLLVVNVFKLVIFCCCSTSGLTCPLVIDDVKFKFGCCEFVVEDTIMVLLSSCVSLTILHDI